MPDESAEALASDFRLWFSGKKTRSKNESRSKAFARFAREFLLTGQKEPKAPSPTRAVAAAPRRCPALLGRRGTRPKLAALRHGPLYGPAVLRCSARFKARNVNVNVNVNSTSTSTSTDNSNNNSRSGAAHQRPGLARNTTLIRGPAWRVLGIPCS